jgi:hypothetical protein
MFVVFFAIFRLIAVERVNTGDVWPGALVAAVLLVLAKIGYILPPFRPLVSHLRVDRGSRGVGCCGCASSESFWFLTQRLPLSARKDVERAGGNQDHSALRSERSNESARRAGAAWSGTIVGV